MKKLAMIFLFLIFSSSIYSENTDKNHLISITKEMFNHVFTQLNSNSVKDYFTKDAIIYLNFDKPLSRSQFSHSLGFLREDLSSIHYKYNDFIVSNQKVIIRCEPTTIKKSGKSHEGKQITILQFRNNKIYKMWELTVRKPLKVSAHT